MASRVVSEVGADAWETSAASRSQLRSKLAELSEAECGEVIEYIEVMRSLRCEAADRGLFGDGFARRLSAIRAGRRSARTHTTR